MTDFSQRIGITRFGIPTTGPGFTNTNISDSTSGIAFVLQAQTNDPITHIGFRYGARTGTPPIHVATLEGVSASTGFPDGTDVGGGSPTAVTFTPPADTSINGKWQWYQLTNAYTPTRGQLLAATVRYSSGTVNASNRSSFTSVLTGVIGGTTRFSYPYGLILTTGTWAIGIQCPVGAFRTASRRYGFVIESLYATASASTVGLREAIKFTMPALGSSQTIRGFGFCGNLAQAVGKNPIIGLWNAAGTKLQDWTADSDVAGAPTTSYAMHEYLFDETTLSALTPGTDYYAGLEVADGTNGGVLINGIGVANTSDLLALAGGTSWYRSAWNGAAWVDDNLTRPFAWLLVDDWTASAGGGGLLIGGNLVQ